jgi:hypothetical protein
MGLFQQPAKRRNQMRLCLIVAIVAMMTLTLTAADVAGTWKGTMETQMGSVETIITIQAGEALAGNVKMANFEGKIEKAKLEGDKISFEVNIEPGTVSFAGTVSGDEMKLNVTGTTGNKMTLIAKRQK